jgi:DNA polymerase
MTDLHLDFETYSKLDLKEVGLMNYLQHPSTRVILAAWHFKGSMHQITHEDDIEELMFDVQKADRIHAWNASFEWGVMRFVLGWHVPLEKMYCTMAHALYRAFPADLDRTSRILGGSGKLDEGKRLIKVFCGGGGKARPGDWMKFCLYNRLDVEQEMTAANGLKPHPWPEDERNIWIMSEIINWRGVPIDTVAVEDAVAIHTVLVQNSVKQIEEITGVSNGNSVAQVSGWLRTRGVPTGSLDKESVLGLLDRKLPADVRRVLTLRQNIAMTAPKKYTVAKNQNYKGRMYNMLQYSGAGRTHRWSGRGLQPQNMRRGLKSDAEIAQAWDIICANDTISRRIDDLTMSFDDPFTLLANLVRSIIKTDVPLAVADYSSIEVVMLHWAAGDEEMLQKLRDGLDPYKVFAAWYFKVPYDAVTKDQRTFCKPIILGCGYGLGKGTMVDYAGNMGVTMDEEQAGSAVYGYREQNTKVVRFWYGLQEAMIKTISTGRGHKFGHFRFSMREQACVMHLPAGTEITYWEARVEGDRIYYRGVDQYTGQWSEQSTWGGKLVENAVQSISRDVLVYGLRNAHHAGLDVVLHVHDEIVAPAHDPGVSDTLLECMSPPLWCSNAPIHAAAFTCPRYRKD